MILINSWETNTSTEGAHNDQSWNSHLNNILLDCSPKYKIHINEYMLIQKIKGEDTDLPYRSILNDLNR